jgi:hypothetical protein
MLDENHPLNVLRVAVKRKRGGSHFAIASVDYREFSEVETVRIPALRDGLNARDRCGTVPGHVSIETSADP